MGLFCSCSQWISWYIVEKYLSSVLGLILQSDLREHILRLAKTHSESFRGASFGDQLVG